MHTFYRRFWFDVYFASIYVGNICNTVMLLLTEGLMLTLQNLWSVLISCKDRNQIVNQKLKINVLKIWVQ